MSELVALVVPCIQMTLLQHNRLLLILHRHVSISGLVCALPELGLVENNVQKIVHRSHQFDHHLLVPIGMFVHQTLIMEVRPLKH